MVLSMARSHYDADGERSGESLDERIRNEDRDASIRADAGPRWADEPAPEPWRLPDGWKEPRRRRWDAFTRAELDAINEKINQRKQGGDK